MKWSDLSMAERARIIALGVQSGITNLNDIRNIYNSFAEGGQYSAGKMVNTLYESAAEVESLGEPEHHYDFTQSEEWANAHGYYPDERGHRDDRVKKPAHPTHPSRGQFKSMNEFELSDKGMEDPNYTLFGLVDGGQDPQATMTYKGSIVLPELTVTPNRTYIHNPYDNINILLGNKHASGGHLYGEGGDTNWDDTPEGIVSNAAVGLIPIVGTGNEVRQLIQNPSWEQAGWTGLSLLGDLATIFTFGAGEGAKAAITTAKTTRSLSKAAKAYKSGKQASKAARASRRAEKAYKADVVTRRGGPSVSRNTNLRRQRANDRLLNGPTYFQRESKTLNNQETFNSFFNYGTQGTQTGLELWMKK